MNWNDELVGRRARVLPGARIRGTRPWPPGSFTERLTSLSPGALGEITDVNSHASAPYSRYCVRLDDWTYVVDAKLGSDIEIVKGCRSAADLAAMAAIARTVYDLSEPMLAALRASWRPGMTTAWRGPVLHAPARSAEELVERGLACCWRAGTSDPGAVRLTGTGMTLATALHAADLHIGTTTDERTEPR